MMSAGVHRELRQGALLVQDAAEVVEAVGAIGADLAPERHAPDSQRDLLDPLARRVLDAVPVRRPATLDSVARTAGVAPAEAQAALGLLELDGLVESTPRGWRLGPAGRSG
jgi:DNA processing protein